MSGCSASFLCRLEIQASFHQPATILPDEPTNNPDKEGRDYLPATLKQWRGLAVIASHDRQLLNAMDSITELRDGSAFSYDGALIVISHDQNFLDNIGITKTISINSYTA